MTYFIDDFLYERLSMSIRLNTTAPDFVAESTQGTIRFHDWTVTVGHSWRRRRLPSPAFA